MTQRFLNYGVTSDVPLPLPQADPGWVAGQWIHIRTASLEPVKQADRFEWAGDFHPHMYCEMASDSFDLVFMDYCRARISPGDSEVTVDIHSDDESAIGHLLLDQILPRMLGQQGKLLLHGGAVSSEQGALVFLGDSGSGKSTLCASFYEDDWRLISDDCVQVNPDRSVMGTYPGLRLYDDSISRSLSESGALVPMAAYSEKRRLMANFGPQESAALRALILLESEDEQIPDRPFSIEPLCGSAAALCILNESFSLWPRDTSLASHKLKVVSELLRQGVPVFRCAFTRNFSELPALKNSLLAAL